MIRRPHRQPLPAYARTYNYLSTLFGCSLFLFLSFQRPPVNLFLIYLFHRALPPVSSLLLKYGISFFLISNLFPCFFLYQFYAVYDGRTYRIIVASSDVRRRRRRMTSFDLLIKTVSYKLKKSYILFTKTFNSSGLMRIIKPSIPNSSIIRRFVWM